MSEVKDPALKLFGKTIPLQESHVSFEAGDKSDKGAQIRAESEEMDAYKVTEVEAGDLSNKSSSFNDIKEDNNLTSSQENKPEEDQAETDTVGEEKILKKPDKILPCPRCNSLDTKFCYYNNYNVNQPRHFCKNCQRYWTAGGTMRNVPVGAGRRKNKHPSSQYHHIMKENGSVLKFGPKVHLCDSMTSVNLMDQKGKLEMGPVSTIENGEESSSCTTSITPSFRQKNELPENVVQMEHDGILGSCGEVTPTYPPQGYPTPPWAYSWHPCWNNMISMALGSGLYSSNPNLLPWVSLQMVASPGFVPASYLGYMPSWNTPSNSPTLGKHSREANSEEEKPEKCFWVPKTLRIDDPDDAVKSSIWATLGIKPNKKVPIKNGGIFKPFQHKTGGEVRKSDAAHVLQANPAAFSRWKTFQEST